MSLLAAVVALGLGDASADRALLDAFRAACERVDTFDAMKADAASSGWEEIADDADPRVARLLRTGRKAVGGGGTAQGANFRRSFAGRPVFLIQSRYEDRSGYWGNGCRLYHFEANARIDPALLRQWMGRPPTGAQNFNGVGAKLLWEPGWRSGVSVEVNHVPGNSKVHTRYGLSGNILVATAIGGF